MDKLNRSQQVTGAGCMATLCAGMYLAPKWKVPHLIAFGSGFGAGTLISCAFLRLGYLLKSGKRDGHERNVFGQGALAAVALVGALTMVLRSSECISNMSQLLGADLLNVRGLVCGGMVLGFIQHADILGSYLSQEEAKHNREEE